MNKLFHVLLLSLASIAWANEPAKRLFDDLMIKYNRLRRPVDRSSRELTVRVKLRLSQIIDVVGVCEEDVQWKWHFAARENADNDNDSVVEAGVDGRDAALATGAVREHLAYLCAE